MQEICLDRRCQPRGESDAGPRDAGVGDAGDPDGPPPISVPQTIFVTDPVGFSAVAREQTMGLLLEELALKTIHSWAPEGEGKADQAHDWIRAIFEKAHREFEEHENGPRSARIGMVGAANPYAHLLELWPNIAEREVGSVSEPIGGGPFRLLAVVNRMDLAGDYDRRGLFRAAKTPRSFGEGRLIFGVIDPEYEATHRAPYPMVFSLEYRLPGLRADRSVRSGYPYTTAIKDPAEWNTQMRRWGQLWADLTGQRRSGAKYQQGLLEIVKRFARPDHFIAVRSNVRLEADGRVEFELRDWYLNLTGWLLFPRHLRDEPYRCVEEGQEFKEIINHYWDRDRQDLLMGDLEDRYSIPRHDFNWEHHEMSVPVEGCSGHEFEIHPDPESGHHEGTRFPAAFGRVVHEQIWTAGMFAPGEGKRHAFAIRTCTGCHGTEAGVFGFHVSPRLEGEPSKLSPFLLGDADDGTEFSFAGRDYRYFELERRRAYLESVLAGRARVFEGLYRNDRR